MKFTGKIEKLIQDLFKLDRDKSYVIEIKELKNKRTLRQNAYMWKLIHEIANKWHVEDLDVYIQALEQANAKSEYVLGLPTIENELKKNFRAVKVVRPEIYKGKKMIVYECFIGSSKMNTKEMSELLEIIINWATQLGIPVLEDYYL